MKNWVKSSLIIACFAGVVGAIGFYNFRGKQIEGARGLTPLSELALNDSQTLDLPFDISKLGNTMLSCTNKGTTAKNLDIDFLTTAGGASYTLPIKKGATVSKYVKNIASELGITAKFGSLSFAKDADISCYYKGVGSQNTITPEDVATEGSIITDSPSSVGISSIVNHHLVILNASFGDTTFNVKSYLKDGKEEWEKAVTTSALNRSVIVIKDVEDRIFHITPTTAGAKYLAFVWETVPGVSYVFKGEKVVCPGEVKVENGKAVCTEKAGTIDLPFDITKFGNTMLSCTNKGATDKNLAIDYLTTAGNSAYTLTVKRNATVSKYVRDIANELGVTAKIGSLSFSGNSDVNCYYKGIGVGGTVEVSDVGYGESYILDTPTLFNMGGIVHHQLLIFNPSFNDGKFNVKTYLEDGTVEQEQSVTVQALNRSVISLKTAKNKTIHIIPEAKDAKYLALVWATVPGTSFVFKGERTFNNAVVTPKGVLSVANVTSAPATFGYIVTSNNQKVYEGEEWVLPFGQRKIDLSEISTLSNLKMELTPVSYYYPKVCNDEGQCFADESKGNATLVMSYVSSKTTAPTVIRQTTESFSEEIRNAQKAESKLSVSCDIDNIVKPFCNKDTNSNGITDADELFHYFADPTVEDTDGDGFSNAEEIARGTKAFHRFDFPGKPDITTIEGMQEMAKIVEAVYNEEQSGITAKNGAVYAAFTEKSKEVPDNPLYPLFDERTRPGMKVPAHQPCGRKEICIDFPTVVQNELNDSDKLSDILGDIVDCVRLARDLTADVMGEDCSVCESDFVLASEAIGDPACADGEHDLKIRLDTKGGVFRLNPNGRAGVNVDVNALYEYETKADLCAEILSEYTNTNYNRPRLRKMTGSLSPIALKRGCLTGAEVFLNQVRMIAEMTGVSYSDVLEDAVDCTWSDSEGEHSGKMVRFRGHEGTCLGLGAGFRVCPSNHGECAEGCHYFIDEKGGRHCCGNDVKELCNNACCPGECVDGVCKSNKEPKVECPKGTKLIDGKCVCGDRGAVCGVHDVCKDGRCRGCEDRKFGNKDGECVCRKGEHPSGSGCVCGKHSRGCYLEERCVEGECVQDCPPNYIVNADGECICEDNGTSCAKGMVCDTLKGCINCPEGMSEKDGQCYCPDGRPACPYGRGGDSNAVCCGKKELCVEATGSCGRGRSFGCKPEGFKCDEGMTECPGADGEYKCTCGISNWCEGLSVCFNAHCHKCPYGTKDVKNNKCICEDDRAACGVGEGVRCCEPGQSCVEGRCRTATACTVGESGQDCIIAHSDSNVDCIGTRKCSIEEKEEFESTQGGRCKQLEDGSFCCAGNNPEYDHCFANVDA